MKNNRTEITGIANRLADLREIVRWLSKAVCPPFIWHALRTCLGYSPTVKGNYQGVIAPSPMTRLHKGRFSEIHEKFSVLDTHIQCDKNVTRLRVYTVCCFGDIALHNTNTGDFLTAGISFGTAPLIVAEYLELATRMPHRHVYLVDPLNGSNSANTSGTASYNRNFDLVSGRWDPAVPVTWIKKFLTPSNISNVGRLAMVHLNTGDYASELLSLPALYERLIPGGFIIQDLYGWCGEDRKNQIDSTLESLGAKSYLIVTRQLVIFKAADRLP